MSLIITCRSPAREAEAARVAKQLGSELTEAQPGHRYQLLFDEADVRLRSAEGVHGDILVDFCGGSAAHRRKFGGGKGQLIAKAVGIKGSVRPLVYDMTAGLGGDAFVLASLGCEVHLFERNPVVHALLADGLLRAEAVGRERDPELLSIVQRMHLFAGDGIEHLRKSPERPPVVYVDPMFPERKKSASVKKEMQAFHEVVGPDEDAGLLLAAALDTAENRVVVKRPRIAPAVAAKAPSYSLEGKSARYDIYALKKIE